MTDILDAHTATGTGHITTMSTTAQNNLRAWQTKLGKHGTNEPGYCIDIDASDGKAKGKRIEGNKTAQNGKNDNEKGKKKGNASG